MQIHNPNSNYGKFAIIRIQAGLNSYKLSNAVFINDGLPQPERLAKLNAIAIQKMCVLTEDHRILKLEKENSES